MTLLPLHRFSILAGRYALRRDRAAAAAEIASTAARASFNVLLAADMLACVQSRQRLAAGPGVLALPLACSGAGDYAEDRIEAIETRD
jgi:hypothetical protein